MLRRSDVDEDHDLGPSKEEHDVVALIHEEGRRSLDGVLLHLFG
jgi:hypothetical protein